MLQLISLKDSKHNIQLNSNHVKVKMDVTLKKVFQQIFGIVEMLA